MMAEHAKSGMTFAGKVQQLITVALGLDDWEWGVTLWAKNPQFLTHIVYRMRFDEASRPLCRIRTVLHQLRHVAGGNGGSVWNCLAWVMCRRGVSRATLSNSSAAAFENALAAA